METKELKAELYHRLTMFGSQWPNSVEVAKLLCSCTTNIIEKPVKYGDPCVSELIGLIDWTSLNHRLQTSFGIKLRRSTSKKVDLWTVYRSIIKKIFDHDIITMIRYYKPISRNQIDNEALTSLLTELHIKYNVEIKLWQINGMLDGKINMTDFELVILDIMHSKKIYIKELKY